MNLKKLKQFDKVHIADTESIGLILNKLLADEYQAWYHYISVVDFLVGNERTAIVDKFKEMGKDELDDHAAKLVKRISELSLPMLLTTTASWNTYSPGFKVVPLDVMSQLNLNLGLENTAINNYYNALNTFTEIADAVTCDMIKEIIADEEEHKNILSDFINDLNA